MAATSNEAQELYKQHKESRKLAKEECETRKKKQQEKIAEYNAWLAPLNVEYNILHSKICTIKRERDLIAKQDHSVTLQDEKWTARENLKSKIYRYLKENIELVYTQLREQYQKAKQIYDDFVKNRVNQRLNDNRWIMNVFNTGGLNITLLKVQKHKIMGEAMPHKKSSKLLSDIANQIDEIRQSNKKYMNNWTILQDKNSTLRSFDFFDDPRLVRQGNADIVETYQKLQEIYNNWFKLYYEVWRYKIHQYDNTAQHSEKQKLSSMYKELLPFFRIYVHFQWKFCDSTICNDEICTNCGGGLLMTGERLEMKDTLNYYYDYDFSVRFESHSVHVPSSTGIHQKSGGYDTWTCKNKEKSLHF